MFKCIYKCIVVVFMLFYLLIVESSYYYYYCTSTLLCSTQQRELYVNKVLFYTKCDHVKYGIKYVLKQLTVLDLPG